MDMERQIREREKAELKLVQEFWQKQFKRIYKRLKQSQQTRRRSIMILFETYWESRRKFIIEVIPLLGLNSNDVIVEAGSGKGLAAFQFAFENLASEVIGIEMMEGRFHLSRVTHGFFTVLTSEGGRDITTTPCQFIHGDFRSDDFKHIMDKGTVVYGGLDSDPFTRDYLKNLLETRGPGFRLCCPFVLTNMDPRIQVVILDAKPEAMYPESDSDEESEEGSDTESETAEARPARPGPRQPISVPIVQRQEGHFRNTTLHQSFLPFYIYTVRNAPIDEFETSPVYDEERRQVGVREYSKVFQIGRVVHFPFQIGLRWETLSGKIIWQNGNNYMIETTPSPESRIMMSTCLPSGEICSEIIPCKSRVEERNRTLPPLPLPRARRVVPQPAGPAPLPPQVPPPGPFPQVSPPGSPPPLPPGSPTPLPPSPVPQVSPPGLVPQVSPPGPVPHAPVLEPPQPLGQIPQPPSPPPNQPQGQTPLLPSAAVPPQQASPPPIQGPFLVPDQSQAPAPVQPLDPELPHEQSPPPDQLQGPAPVQPLTLLQEWMEYTIRFLLTKEVAEKLGITPDNVIYLGKGYRNGNEKFFVVDGDIALDPTFEHPCKFTQSGSKALNFKIPSGSLTNMANIFGDKNHVKHLVQVTTSKLSKRTNQESISQMERYFVTEFGDRMGPNCIRAMPYIPIAIKDRWSIQPPEVLRNDDLSYGRQIGYPDDDDDDDDGGNMMDLMASMIGQGSLQRFHCHKDDSIVWVTVTRGIKVYFFLLDPKTKDMEFVKGCSDTSQQGNLMSDDMNGRIICCVLRPGESLIFRGSVPHAIYAASDVLAYGGRFITPTRLSDVYHFTKANISCCTGHGYTYQQVIDMMHKGIGGIWYTLWRMKFLQPKDFDKSFDMAGDIINEVIYNHGGRLKITAAKERWTKAFYLSLYNMYTTTFIPSIFGVFYSKDTRIQIVTAFQRVLNGKHFIPALTNVVEGLPFRNTDPPHVDDLDYDAKGTVRKVVSIDDIFPDLLTANYGACVGICEGSFGMFASYDLPKDFGVAQFTGHLRTNKQLDEFYGVKQHPGKIYFLQERVGKNGKNQNVFIDSNQYGSFSLLVKSSDKPNCRLEKVSVEHRLILVIKSEQPIKMGEELLIPEPMFPESSVDGLVSIDSYLEGLDVQESTLSFDEPDPDLLQEIIDEEDEQEEATVGHRRRRGQEFLERARRYHEQLRLHRTTDEIIQNMEKKIDDMLKANLEKEPETTPETPAMQSPDPDAAPPSPVPTSAPPSPANTPSPPSPGSPKWPDPMSPGNTPSPPSPGSPKWPDPMSPGNTPSPPSPDSPDPTADAETQASPKPPGSPDSTAHAEMQASPQPPGSPDSIAPAQVSPAAPANPIVQDQEVDDGQVAGPSRRMTRMTAARMARAQRGILPTDRIPDTHRAKSRSSSSSSSSEEDSEEDQPRGRRKSRVPKTTKKRHKVSFKRRKVTQEPPVPEEGEEEDQEVVTPPEMFEFNGEMHEVYRIPKFPHAIIQPFYKNLSRAEKEALKNKLVALFYPILLNYVNMNNDLLQRYNQLVDNRACAVCAHLGLPVEGYVHKPMKPFSSNQKFKEHHERFHKHRFQCETCKKWFDNARARKGHYTTMTKYQKDPDHIMDKKIRKQREKEEKEAKAKAKEEKKKQKKEKKKGKAPESESEEDYDDLDPLDFVETEESEEESEDEPLKEGSDQESENEGEPNDPPPGAGRQKRKRAP